MLKCGGAVAGRGGRGHPRLREAVRHRRRARRRAADLGARCGSAVSTCSSSTGGAYVRSGARDRPRVARRASTHRSARPSVRTAIGFMGDDIGLEATQVSKLGLVGDPLPSRPALVVSALAAGSHPGHRAPGEGPAQRQRRRGRGALAVGLGAERILFVTDVPGVADRRRRRRVHRRRRGRPDARRRHVRGRDRAQAPGCGPRGAARRARPRSARRWCGVSTNPVLRRPT